MASYEHEGRSPKLVTIDGCRQGLGVRITGGRSRERQEQFGIFIKEVIPGSLAAKDGQLHEGDQLLEANGKSLVDVSNERAVEILKLCTATDSIKLLLSRDAAAKSQYRRLSEVLAADVNSPLPANTPKAPVTSTPFRNETDNSNKLQPSSAQQNVAPTPSNVVSDSGASLPWGSPLQSPNFDSSSAVLQWQKQPNSASKPPVMYPSDDQGTTAQRPSSVSSNDSGSHDENNGPKIKSPSSTNAEHTMPISYDGSQLALSDVVLSEEKNATAQKSLSSPSHLHERGIDVGEHGSPAKHPDPSSPNAAAQSFEPGSHSLSSDQHDLIIISKDKGLGITLAGGVGSPDGPGIYVARILEGLDASNDGRLSVGDQILKINEESFDNLQLEKAKHLLTQMKARQHVRSYVIQIKKHSLKAQVAENKSSLRASNALSSNNHLTSKNTHTGSSPQPQPNAVFDSSTLVVADDTLHGKSPQSTQNTSLQSPPESAVHVRNSSNRRSKQTGFGNTERTSAYDSMRQRLSVDSGARFKLTKLEYALNYLGFKITPEKQEQFRKLDIDEQGKVVLSDFIALCKEMFPLEIGSLNLESQLTLALTQKDSSDLPKPSMVPSEKTSLEELLKEFSSRTREVPAQSDESDLGSSKSTPVKHGDQHCLEHSPNEQDLQKKLTLTEKALKASKKKERDLHIMVQTLNEELALYRQNSPLQSSAELQKRLAVMDCERRKEQATARRYQVATEKLLEFAEDCHDILVNSPDASRILFYVQGSGQSTLRGDQVTGNPRPPRYLSKHAKETAITLAKKAKDVTLSVREILKTEELPVGWEKCFDEYGSPYYVNHQTQTTSRIHP